MLLDEKSVPDQDTILQELHDLTIYLYKVLDASTQKSHEFFVSDAGSLDPYLYPCLVRYYTKRTLLKEEPDAQWTVKELENNGLYVVYEQYHIRILKSNNGQLPPAGPSRIKQCFYCQKPLWSLQDLPSNGKRCASLNFVILWDTDPVTKMLQLKLAFPKYGTANSAVVHWMQDIQHPVFSINEEVSASLYVVELDDLDISIDEDGLEGDMHSA